MTVAIAGNLLLLGTSFYYWIKSFIFGAKNTFTTGAPQQNRIRQKIKLQLSCFLFFNSCLPWAMYLLYINNTLFGETGAQVFSIAFIVITGTQVSFSYTLLKLTGC